ncbi:MAG: hypothetical protein ABMA14_10525 [Hyphomonadaceae bacterium]
MRFVVKAMDLHGKAVASLPMTRREAVMKVWEFKTSGYTQIRTFDAATNEGIDIIQKPE